MSGPVRSAGAGLSAAKRALLERQMAGAPAAPAGAIPRRGGGAPPLSFAQQRMWFFDRMEPGSTLYTVRRAVRLPRRVDAAVLARALDEVACRHEALRTTFAEVDGVPVQRVAERGGIPLEFVDLAALPADRREPEAARSASRHALRPWDLAAGPLARAALLRLGEEDHVLSVAMHHVVSDAWSLDVLLREVAALYEAFAAGRPSPLPPLPIQYPDYAAWQRERLRGPTLERELEYWTGRLRGAPMVLEFPADLPRPPLQSYEGAQHRFAVPAGLRAALAALAQRERATPFMVLLAAWQLLLSRYTGQDDVLVGTPIANRTRSETEPLIGFFANTLVLRGELAGDPTFREFLARTRSICLEAYAHQDLPFEKLVEALQPERDLARPPLVQAMFSLQNAGAPAGAGATARAVGIDVSATHFELTLELAETPRGLAGIIEYSTSLFLPSTAERLAGHFLRLLEEVAADPDRRLSALPLLGHGELEALEAVGEGPRRPRDAADTVQALFARAAARHPERVAIEGAAARWSYAELHARADAVARHLRARGVGVESRVALLVERTPEMVAALLGVLMAGAAYLPLDPEHPRERWEQALDDAGAALVLASEGLGARLAGARAEVLPLAGCLVAPEGDDGAPLPAAHPRSAAYVIYTSGSTGRPKGVVVEHGGLTNYALHAVESFGLCAEDRVLQFASIAFDAAAEEVFATLAAGATLVLRGDELEPAAFLRACAARGVTVMDLPTAFWQMMVGEVEAGNAALPASLRLVVIGGERAHAATVRGWHGAAPGVRLVNSYGPTESTVAATECELAAGGAGEPPIGFPLANARVRVLSAALFPVPAGGVGELCVGGAGVARGSLGRPALTAERFVPDPFGEPGARIYRTGDLARLRADGALEYIGRADQQVKIRGFRVELGEVEVVLAGHPEVREACVVARTRAGAGGPRLAAYIVPATPHPPSAAELRAWLGGVLPAYMVPTAFVTLAEFPRTPGGKVDRRALPEPAGEEEAAYTAPRTATEEIVSALWCEVLGVERVGAHDSFFAAGGHSLLATQVLSRLRRVFGVELPLRDVFEYPTPAALSTRVDEALRGGTRDSAPPLVATPRSGPAPASFAQQRLWFLEQLSPGTAVHNVPGALRLSGRVDVEALRRAVDELVRRHEVLRTTLRAAGGVPVQVVGEPGAVALEVVEPGGVEAGERESRAWSLAQEQACTPFSLAEGPLMRVALLRLADDDHLFAFTLHHAVTDQWSTGVMVRELGALYDAYSRGLPSPLPEPAAQYADYAVWQRGWLAGEVLEGQLAWWRERLADAPAVLELPTDRPRQAASRAVAGREAVHLPPELGRALHALARREGATLFMTLLAAFQLLLHRHSGQDDLVVGTPIANRTRSETEPLIGFFVNTLALRSQLPPGATFRELLARVRASTLDAYAHQDLPFERLVEEPRPERTASHAPVFQVLFAFQNAPSPALELPGLTLRTVEVGAAATPFDLALVMTEGTAGVGGSLVYDASLFDEATMRRWAGHFVALLQAVADDPDLAVRDIPLMDAHEESRVLSWGARQAVRPAPGCLHERFAEQARRTPGAEAVVCGAERLTYAELEARADGVARRLRALGVGPEARVAVLMERGVEMVAVLLGVLRAGGAYVPLDPRYPDDRLAYAMEDSGARVVLVGAGLAERVPAVPAVPGVTVVAADGAGAEVSGAPGGEARPENVAYVIYTSGSTGRPKGVMVEHRQVARLLDATEPWFRFGPGDTWTLFHSYAFDFSVWEMWGALLTGGRLVVVPYEVSRSPGAFFRLLCDEGVTVLNQTPSAFRPLAAAALAGEGEGREHRLRTVIFGGEALEPRTLLEWMERFGGERPRLVNMYGITETTVHVTGRTLTLDDARGGASSPVGRPIPDLSLRLLDARLRPVPLGVRGELCVGGDGVARGYLGRPALTAERFVPDPFGEPGARMYRSGDHGRLTAGGELEYLGRGDQQVKVRGFRIEPGEIEAALLAHPAVRECVVAAREDTPGDRRLVAYVVGGAGAGELRSHTAALLPEYMIPSAFVELDALPLTPNGKVDRRALPAPEGGRGAVAGTFTAPRTVVEEVVAGIWEEVLGVREVGVHDSFFELGGHSLLATQLLARVRDVLGVELSLRGFFDTPTVAAWSREIEQRLGGADGGLLSELMAEVGALPGGERAGTGAAEDADG